MTPAPLRDELVAIIEDELANSSLPSDAGARTVYMAMLRRAYWLGRGGGLVRVTRNLSIAAAMVASLEIETRPYAYYPRPPTLIIRMRDGREHRVEHTAGMLDGVDVYEVKRAIETALEGGAA